MKNKKGFTLIELLAVIAIIALISLVAIPNIVGLSDGVRKDQMLDDAKKLISLAKYKVNKSYEIRNSSYHDFTFDELNEKGDLKKINESGDVQDPDGGLYNRSRSKVRYYVSNNKAKYCVVLIGEYRTIGASSCLDEENLYSRANVIDK